jgi:hypothetical protein
MSFAIHLRPSTAKTVQHVLYVDFLRTRLQAPIRISEVAHAFRGAPGAIVRILRPMDLSSVGYHKSRAFHSSVNSNFRSSPQLMLPVRRRRRGTARKTEPRADDSTSEEDDGMSTLERMHSPVSDTYEFNQAASRLMDKIELAVEPMKVYNEVFNTKRSDGEIGQMFTIDLGPKVGIYQMEISQEEFVFEYSSPISGRLLYCLSSATGEWVNVDDGHQFEGILVRDLLRSNCIGLPKL